ncbi:MAG: ribonuclease HI family protein [Calditrichaeota bacterium]|nr:ribonuclease HI family protein [Calditrichota bacterium]
MTKRLTLARTIWQFLKEHQFFKRYPQWSPEEVQTLLGIPPEEGAEEPSHSDEAATGNRLVRLFTDGAARGNPGPAGAGIVIQDEKGRTIDEVSCFLGEATNNQAEYQALQLGLERVLLFHPHKLEIALDSELIVKQIRGEYRTRNAALKAQLQKVQELLTRIPFWNIRHIPRARNKRADQLANQAIDEWMRGTGSKGTQSFAR